jgi:acyl-CoA dehydrogenase
MSRPETALAGGVLAPAAIDDDFVDLRNLVDEIGRRSFAAGLGQRRPPERFDESLWRHLEETGLARLTSGSDLGAGPAELAVVLRGVARHAGAVPIAETDLLAAWLGRETGLSLPADGPLTVAIADASAYGGTVAGTAVGVPWTRAAAAVVLIARTPDGLYVGVAGASELDIVDGHNLAGEPRDRVGFDIAIDRLSPVDAALYDELLRRGAWTRCIQIIGALDAAAELSVAHCQQRIQFGRTLSMFQAVQHSLAAMAGEIEKGRAAATLAVVAVTEHGFDSPQADYTVSIAKVVLGRIAASVATIAHQLHGAIGVSVEHPLWLATMRARSWIYDFGSTGHYARRLGHQALRADDLWDFVIGRSLRDSR